MTKKTLLFIITLAIGLGLFIYLFKFGGPREILARLSLVSPIQFIVLFSISFLCLLITLARWSLILRAQGHSLSLRDLLSAKLAEVAISFLTPVLYVGGEGVRAFIIKKNARVPLTEGFSSIAIDRVAEIGAVILFFFFALIWLVIVGTPLIGVLAGLSLLLMVVVVVFAFFRLKIFSIERLFRRLAWLFQLGKSKNLKKERARLSERIGKFWLITSSFFRSHPKVFVKTIILSLLIIGLTIVQFKLLFLALGYSINWNEAILIRVITGALSFIPIPGSLGTYEGGVTLSLRTLGIGAEGSMAFCLLIRALQAIMVILGLICIFSFAVELLLRLFLKENHEETK